MFLHNILARPLTQLGDGDGEREGVEEGDAGMERSRDHQTSPLKVIYLCNSYVA